MESYGVWVGVLLLYSEQRCWVQQSDDAQQPERIIAEEQSRVTDAGATCTM